MTKWRGLSLLLAVPFIACPLAVTAEDSRIIYRTASAKSKLTAVVKSGLNQEKNDLELKQYFVVRHLYFGIFHDLELTDHFALEDKVGIIRTLMNNLSAREPAVLVIERYSGVVRGLRPSVSSALQETGDDLVVSLRVVPETPRGKILVLLTNRNFHTGEIIKAERDMGRAHANVYSISGGYLMKISSKPEQAGEQGDKRALAQSFLHDDRADNDSQIEPLLLEVLSEPAADPMSRIRRAAAYMSLVEYYVASSDEAKARAALKQWQKVIDSGPEAERSPAAGLHREASELIEIVRELVYAAEIAD